MALGFQDFRLKSCSVHVEDIPCDDGPVFAAQPAQGHRSRHSELGDDIGIAHVPDEVPKPMVVGLLQSGVGGGHDRVVNPPVGENQPSPSKDCEKGAGRTTTASSLSSFRTRKYRMLWQSALRRPRVMRLHRLPELAYSDSKLRVEIFRLETIAL